MRSPFCSKCDNMLYIKIAEDDSNQIEYFCRYCGNIEKPANNNMILTVMNTSVENKDIHFSHIVNEYTKFDPTLPRITNMTCPNNECSSRKRSSHGAEDEAEDTKKNEIIYIRYDDKNLKYLYLCTSCDHVWNR